MTISAMVAVEASAVEYHTSASPTTLSGTQATANVFHIPGAGSVECTGANFTGTISGKTVQEIQLSPAYSGCKAFGFATTDMITTDCHYKLTQPTGVPKTYKTTNMHIVCTNGPIKITPTFFGASVCTVEIGSQTPGGSMHIENKEGHLHVLIISYLNEMSHSAGCGASAAADGEYTGGITEKGSNEVWVE